MFLGLCVCVCVHACVWVWACVCWDKEGEAIGNVHISIWFHLLIIITRMRMGLRQIGQRHYREDVSCWLLFLFSHWVTPDSLWPHGLYSPPGSSVHGISQARLLEWAAISFSRFPVGASCFSHAVSNPQKSLQQHLLKWFQFLHTDRHTHTHTEDLSNISHLGGVLFL